MSAPGRVLRAGLLIPLLAGVLAMHVLLLCADGGGGRSHDGHARALPGPAHVMSSGHAVTSAAASAGVEMAAVVGMTSHHGAGRSTDGLALCLAVLVVALVSGLRGRAVAFPLRAAPRGVRVPVLVASARPPPTVPLGILLCVSRT